jgi:hypothetical protein
MKSAFSSTINYKEMIVINGIVQRMITETSTSWKCSGDVSGVVSRNENLSVKCLKSNFMRLFDEDET